MTPGDTRYARRRTTAPLARLLVWAGLSWAGGPTAAAACQAAPLVLRNVTVVDVLTGRRLPNRSIVIVGNRISAVGPVQTVPVPSGARVMDVAGKYAIPGLWDMHVHPQREPQLFYSLFLANGVTGIRDASSPVPLDTLRQWREEILAGTRVGPPRQLFSGRAIDDVAGGCRRLGSSGDIPHVCIADETVARHLVDSLKAAHADMVKTYDLSTATYFAVAAEARRVGLPFGGHVVAPGLTASAASDSGASILDHVPFAGGLDTLCWGPRASLEHCAPVAERFRRNGTWWMPSMTIAEGTWGPTSQRVIRSLRKISAQFYADSLPSGPWLRETGEARPAGTTGYLDIVRRVHLPIVAGTDASLDAMILGYAPGFSLHAELALYVAEGLTALEALQSTTLDPAKLLRGTDSLGSVAAGKLADLVLLDADPLVDIGNTTAIRAVIANGRYYDRAALDQLLAEVRDRGRELRSLTIPSAP